MGLKVKLLQKIGNHNFAHHWKNIILNQVYYPEHPGICFENLLVSRNYTFTFDLMDAFKDWKNRSARVGKKCINHCVWGNNLITDIGSKLWSTKLINCNVNYLSDFLDNGNVMSYENFCRITLNRTYNIISSREYVDIKMAIRRFCNSNVPQRNLGNIDCNLSLKFFIDHTNKELNGTKIRDVFAGRLNINDIQTLRSWVQDLGTDINWEWVFKNMYIGISNNFKVLQFQYKLLMKISTCRYKRYKMNIEKDSPRCYHCNIDLETLPHIFLYCKKSLDFATMIENSFIKNMQEDYHDPKKVIYITCSHENKTINYILAVTKLYISRCYQQQKELSLTHFRLFVSGLLVGEKEPTSGAVKLAIGLV